MSVSANHGCNVQVTVIVKVTDTCKGFSTDSQTGAVTSSTPCCTNVPHFNIDYLAFQQLAHPDYGWMNIQFRKAFASTALA